jgi:hypothetical protein
MTVKGILMTRGRKLLDSCLVLEELNNETAMMMTEGKR